MPNYLIYQPRGETGFALLNGIPGVETIGPESALSRKLFIHSEMWLRDQIVWLDGVAYETLNTRGEDQYIVSQLLRARGVEVSAKRYLPFQGGHLVQTKDKIFCASSCGLDVSMRQRAFEKGERKSWSLETLTQFSSGESSRVIHQHIPAAIVLPSLTDLPWSYHADLVVTFLGKLALLSDPSLFKVDEVDPAVEVGVKHTEGLLLAQGYEVLRFPLYYHRGTQVFHAPLNGLIIQGVFYYSLIEGMESFNEFVTDYSRKNLPVPSQGLMLPAATLGTGGGVRCLSLQW